MHFELDAEQAAFCKKVRDHLALGEGSLTKLLSQWAVIHEHATSLDAAGGGPSAVALTMAAIELTEARPALGLVCAEHWLVHSALVNVTVSDANFISAEKIGCVLHGHALAARSDKGCSLTGTLGPVNKAACPKIGIAIGADPDDPLDLTLYVLDMTSSGIEESTAVLSFREAQPVFFRLTRVPCLPSGTSAASFVHGLRLSTAAVACGLSRRALELGKKVGRKAARQNIQFALSDMATRIDAAELVTLAAARLRDRALPHRLEAASAMHLSTSAAVSCATALLDLFESTDHLQETQELIASAASLRLRDPRPDSLETVAEEMLKEL